MKANFLHEELTKTMKRTTSRLRAAISDANRTNQSCTKKYDTVEGKQWLSVQGSYLLYNDFVYLLESITNLWITEK